MKTYSPRVADISREWHIVDANGVVLGRLASKVAQIIRGKHKVGFAPHMDTGDFVIVVNADKIKVTGNKAENKIYYSHSGYPGGLKMTNFKSLMEKHPERIIEKAVKGMLPKNRLGRQLFTKLKVYTGSEHPHTAQKPQVLEV